MKLAQILLDDAPPRQRRLQALDRAALASRIDVVTIPLETRRAAVLRDALTSSRAEVAHLYAPQLFPGSLLDSIPVPVLASGAARRSRLPWRRTKQPDAILGGPAEGREPEAIDPGYFAISAGGTPTSFRIGCHAVSRGARALADGTKHRIDRFRDDIRWVYFRELPAPAEMGLLNVWVDAEAGGDGLENGVPQALAAGRAVVAAATPANREVLHGGDAGFLVPPEDPNETAHAVLAALFKPELRDPRIARGRQLAEAWRPERRAERLLEIYQRLRS